MSTAQDFLKIILTGNKESLILKNNASDIR